MSQAASSVTITDDDVKALSRMPVLPESDPFAFHNPSQALQEKVVGQSFEATYTEAARFVNYLLGQAFRPSLPQRVLDFGCGWGRMLRVLRFKPELKSVELHGCDVNADFMEPIRRSVPHVYLQLARSSPPLPYVDDWFNVIYAFSVFSHLSPESHLDSAGQFARILKPGGKVVITTQGHNFLRICKEFREGIVPKTHKWHELIAEAFKEPDCDERYERGEFLYRATIPNYPVYGEAVVPRSWFEKEWGTLGFKVVDWVDTEVQNYCSLVYQP
jgi:SAM-dependent methyltransferase